MQIFIVDIFSSNLIFFEVLLKRYYKWGSITPLKSLMSFNESNYTKNLFSIELSLPKRAMLIFCVDKM